MTVNYTEKIAKCEEYIAKKQNLISKREKQIAKQSGIIAPMLSQIGLEVPTVYDKETVRNLENANQHYANAKGLCVYQIPVCESLSEALYTVSDALESIRNARRDIEDKQKTLQTYRDRVAKEENKDILIQQMPSAFQQFRNDLLAKWDEYDMTWRPFIEELYPRYEHAHHLLSRRIRYVPYDYIDYRLLSEEQKAKREAVIEANAPASRLLHSLERKFKPFSHLVPLIGKSDEQIHEENVVATRNLILELYERVIKITGAITDAEYLHVTNGNDGITINGLVKGEKGTARVESHGCAGYNIVRYYVRTNVYPVH